MSVRALVMAAAGYVPPTAAEWTTPGTYSWTVPAGVTSISAVVIGAGGGGGNFAGGGGGLRYGSIPVTPGETFTITVGAFGIGGTLSNSYYDNTDGGYSEVRNTSTSAYIRADGGQSSSNGGYGGSGSGSGFTHTGYQGGNGADYYSSDGVSQYAPAGGGGAAGYAANGGNGGVVNVNAYPGTPVASATGGAATGGWSASGGGVGIYGIGVSGYAPGPYSSNGGSYGLGVVSDKTQHGKAFGGGGGGRPVDGGDGRHGGVGAVRIVWGAGKSYPNNAV